MTQKPQYGDKDTEKAAPFDCFHIYSISNPASSVMHILSLLFNAASAPSCQCVGAHTCVCAYKRTLQCVGVHVRGGQA